MCVELRLSQVMGTERHAALMVTEEGAVQDSRGHSSTSTRSDAAARFITEVFAPAPVAACLLMVAAWHAAALVWGAVSLVFASLLPIAYVLFGVRRQRLSDRHVAVRHQRRGPLAVGIGCVLLGLVVLKVGGAPAVLVALLAAMLAGLATSLVVTVFWKVSIHAAVVAGSEAILVLLFGPWMLAATPVVLLVGWARLELGQHTLAQVVAGVALGAIVATFVFSALN